MLGPPVSPGQAGIGAVVAVGGLFPLIRALPGAGSVSGLFPAIHPSPSPAPGSGGPQSSLVPGSPPPARPAAASQAPASMTANDFLEADLPLGGGQLAALIFLAAAVVTVAAARFRPRSPSPAPAASGPPGRLVPSAYVFPSAHVPARPAAASQRPASTATGESPPAGTATDQSPPAGTANVEHPPAGLPPGGLGGGQVAMLVFLTAALAAGIAQFVHHRALRRG